MSGSEGDQGSTTQAAAADRQSSRFSSTEGKIIVFRSAEGTLFNIHRRNLQSVTDGPLAENFPATPSEVVQLTEEASTLETLFSFVYPGVYPSLKDMPVDESMKLAEAAEKYRVAPAIGMCDMTIQLKMLFKHCPFHIIAHAHRHGHQDLLDLAGSFSLSEPATEARKVLSPSVFAIWVEFRDARLNAFYAECNDIRFRSIHLYDDLPCPIWPRVVFALDKKVSDRGTNTVLDPSALFEGIQETAYCKSQGFRRQSACEQQLLTWRNRLQDRLKDMKPLSALLGEIGGL